MNIPNAQTCRVCGAKLDTLQCVRGLCGKPECDRGDVAYQENKRREWLMATIRQQMPDSWNSVLPIVLLPRNDRSLLPLSSSRVEAHRRYLWRIVVEARTHYANNGDPLAETAASTNGICASDAELPLLGEACGLCRGDCCHTGGNTAWLEPATILRINWFRLGLDDERIVERYLSYLPVASYEDACIYQGEQGCTLPRGLRGQVCNQFLCKGLAELVHALAEPGASCIVAGVIGHSLKSIARVDALGILEAGNPVGE